jgi:DNA ligase-1
MQLKQIVETSRAVAGTRSRLEKRARLADTLRKAGNSEIGLVVNYLAGALPQGKIGLGPAILRELADEPVSGEPTLELEDVDRTFSEIAGITGAGSQAKRRDVLGRLFARATADERDFLVRLILGELRQGALEGELVEGIADAADIPADDLRRAAMLAADPAVVAETAMREGRKGLERFRLEPMSPVRPMLASPAEDMADAMSALGEGALEYKLDGARVQIHRVGRDVKIYSRALNEVTQSLPDVVDAVLALPPGELILDGEVLALREDGRPHPFQVTMRRFGRKTNVDELRAALPLSTFLFDCLYRDGEALIDRSFGERAEQLADAAPAAVRVPSIVTADENEATAFLRSALEAGHEGIMAKALTGTYAAGSRGAEWLKIKQAHTLDLVVIAAEWGSGRRKGWLSNLHLAARNPEDGTFMMLGKTFKGLTDKLLAWQTKKLLELEIGREDNVVHVEPELVVEIAVNDIQASPHYPAGMALRFARVKRYRGDKGPAEADTIDTVRKLFSGQSGETAA